MCIRDSTLAHELTHVIQQRQGPVAGTDYGNGLKVSDPSDRFEVEAEANAVRAMSTPVPRAAPERARPSRPARTGAVQRAVVAQVSSDDSGEFISDIQMAGRPDSPYSGTMGDHSTAYVVQQQAVRNAVIGKTPQQAAINVQALANKTLELPGATMTDSVGFSSRKPDYQAAGKALNATMELLIQGNIQPVEKFPLVQKMIGEFLHFRELIPLTTMNVSQVSQGTAGRGKAESSSSQILSGIASGSSQHSTPEARIAVWKIMDRDGVAMVATEDDEVTLGRLAPGLDHALAPEERAAKIITQHLMSIEMAYPGVIDYAYGSQAKAQTILNESMALEITRRKKQNIAEYTRLLIARTETIEGYYHRGEHHSMHPSKGFETASEDWHRFAAVLKFNGQEPPAFPVPQEPTGRTRSTAKMSSTMSDLTAMLADSSIRNEHEQISSSHSTPARPVRGNTTVPSQAKEKQSLTSQIEMNGHIISAFHSAGRSPSPFSGTMGAHTTAWIAHTDGIRTRIVGKTLLNAAQIIIEEAIPEARTMHSTMSAAFLPNDNSERARRIDLMATASAGLDAAAQELTGFSVAAVQNNQAAINSLPLILQKTISALLTYINYIPGATLEAADTGGKAEGTTRKALLKHENQSERLQTGALRSYLMKLLDVPGDATDGQLGVLAGNHLHTLKAAYPRSVADSRLTQADVLHHAKYVARRKQ